MEKKINFWLPHIPTIIVDTFLNHREQQKDNIYINAMEEKPY
jgi:hypothetical protein